MNYHYYIREDGESKEDSRLEYRKKCWDMATGLQAVDDMKPSKYLYELADRHIDGVLSNQEIEELLYEKYEKETEEEKQKKTRESDLVSNRIVRLLSENAFSFSPVTLKYIHRSLFEGIYDHAGMFRQYNISKKEPILNGGTVRYANYQMIEEMLDYDFKAEKQQKYSSMQKERTVRQLAHFTSDIWQVHPFMEGNTRTTAVFMERYLNAMGFEIDNTPFAKHAKYFRNALVRANYADYSKGIDEDMTFLYRFYENLLLGGRNELKSRDTVQQKCFANPPFPAR